MAQPHDEVMITAPRLVHQQVGTTSGGMPVELVSLDRHVSYADLDLATQSGVVTFEQRISDTAKQACSQLDVLYPVAQYPPNPDSPDCVKSATAEGMAKAKLVIASAHK